MTKEQINKLVSDGIFPEDNGKRTLIETHISWVIVCDRFVYKIKKPVQYSFLDFSTLKLRKHFCEREIELNKRLTEGIYLDVQPIYENEGNFIVGEKKGDLAEYAVRMQKLDKEKQMDQLLLKKQVTKADIRSLAEKIANFHRHTEIIYKKEVLKIREDFNDLEEQKEFLSEKLGDKYKKIIEHAIKVSDSFIEISKGLLAARLCEGFYRDCHGDLHSRNIFLMPAPVPFDCIEFNDDFRQIDVLNEVAFLCTDLDAFDSKDLSDQFIADYNQFFPAIRTSEEQRLFIYYKSYRANVRTKVNSLRANSAAKKTDENRALAESRKYLQLMDYYFSGF